MFTSEHLDAWFKCHVPSEQQRVQHRILRDAAKRFAETILDTTPPGPDQSVAIRKVREAVMTANASIACQDELDKLAPQRP